MLTNALVNRLLASRLVPRDAKLAAIESWRRELASASWRGPLHVQLERRLAEASRLLASSRQNRLGNELLTTRHPSAIGA